MLSTTAAIILDKRNKSWTLRAELKRHRVARASAATSALRQAFFYAMTHMEYHLTALRGIEDEIARYKPASPPPGQSIVSAEASRRSFEEFADIRGRLDGQTVRYNERAGEIEANAKANMALLMTEFLPHDLTKRLSEKVTFLAVGAVASTKAVQEQIALYEQHAPEILALLARCDAVIASEIARPL